MRRLGFCWAATLPATKLIARTTRRQTPRWRERAVDFPSAFICVAMGELLQLPCFYSLTPSGNPVTKGRYPDVTVRPSGMAQDWVTVDQLEGGYVESATGVGPHRTRRLCGGKRYAQRRRLTHGNAHPDSYAHPRARRAHGRADRHGFQHISGVLWGPVSQRQQQHACSASRG